MPVVFPTFRAHSDGGWQPWYMLRANAKRGLICFDFAPWPFEWAFTGCAASPITYLSGFALIIRKSLFSIVPQEYPELCATWVYAPKSEEMDGAIVFFYTAFFFHCRSRLKHSTLSPRLRAWEAKLPHLQNSDELRHHIRFAHRHGGLNTVSRIQ